MTDLRLVFVLIVGISVGAGLYSVGLHEGKPEAKCSMDEKIQFCQLERDRGVK